MEHFIQEVNTYFGELGYIGLAILAFIESSFFPVPPDVLLITMSLSMPQKALLFALVCTIFSTLGGTLGYGIGKFGGRPVFYKLFKKKADMLEKVEALYGRYGAYAVLIAAFTPIPYKVFTISSGIFSINFLIFTIASFIGRGARFFIVGICLMVFGSTIKQYIELVILGCSAVIIVFFIFLYRKGKNSAVLSGQKSVESLK